MGRGSRSLKRWRNDRQRAKKLRAKRASEAANKARKGKGKSKSKSS